MQAGLDVVVSDISSMNFGIGALGCYAYSSVGADGSRSDFSGDV